MQLRNLNPNCQRHINMVDSLSVHGIIIYLEYQLKPTI